MGETSDRRAGARAGVGVRAASCAADGLLLGLFMVSVGVFASLLYAPASPIRAWLPEGLGLRALMGAAMGLTAVALIYSPLGAFSGAQMNPAVTIAFLRLGRIRPMDAAGYVLAQVCGGVLGVVIAAALMRGMFTEPPVAYAVTRPGPWGAAAAWGAEFLMAAGMMTTVLIVSNTKRLARFTGAIAGCVVASYITIEAPVSGMCLNPARYLASAVPAWDLSGLWLYLSAPVLGMLTGAEVVRRVRGRNAVHCCKLNHEHKGTCVHCGCDGPIDFDAHREDAARDRSEGAAG